MDPDGRRNHTQRLCLAHKLCPSEHDVEIEVAEDDPLRNLKNFVVMARYSVLKQPKIIQ